MQISHCPVWGCWNMPGCLSHKSQLWIHGSLAAEYCHMFWCLLGVVILLSHVLPVPCQGTKWIVSSWKQHTKIASIASFFDSLWWFATIGEGKAERCYRQHWDALGHLGTHGTWTVGVGPVVSCWGLVFGCWSRDYGKLQLHQAQYPRRRWQQLHQSSWNRHTRDREESWRKRLLKRGEKQRVSVVAFWMCSFSWSCRCYVRIYAPGRSSMLITEDSRPKGTSSAGEERRLCSRISAF